MVQPIAYPAFWEKKMKERKFEFSLLRETEADFADTP